MTFYITRLSHVLFVILSLALGASPLFAQDGDDKENEVRGRKAWIVATAILRELENPAKFLIGKDLTEVLLSKRSVGSPVKIPEDGVIQMVRQVPNPENEEQPVYKTLAKATIPESVNKALVLMVPMGKNEQGLLYATKVVNLDKFTGGDTLYMNLSPMDVAVQLGSDKIGIRSGKMKLYDAGGLDESVNKTVSYHYYQPDKKKWRLLSASTIVVRPTRREICIFSWDQRLKRVDYHGVTFPVSE